LRNRLRASPLEALAGQLGRVLTLEPVTTREILKGSAFLIAIYLGVRYSEGTGTLIDSMSHGLAKVIAALQLRDKPL
jgi:hypothetical protein